MSSAFHELSFPESVIIGECWARDGLQSQRKIVEPAHKIEIITRMVDAGVKILEATSFAHPKYLPQFADAEVVLRGIPRRDGVRYRGICTNVKAVERAIDAREAGCGVDEIAMVVSASPAHNQANLNTTQDESRRQLEDMTRLALDSGHTVLGWVLTAFGCPIQGDVPVEDVMRLGRWWKEIGSTTVGFGDTVGVANPMQTSRFYEHALADGFTRDEVVVHFHDTRGWGIANTLTALTYGFTLVDSSLGAIGGQPQTGAATYHPGHTGNSCTEDLVSMLEEMGIRTGIDQRKLVDAGKRAEEVLGYPLRSNFIHAGPVPHRGRAYDKRSRVD